MNFLMIFPTVIMLLAFCAGVRLLRNKKRRFRGFILCIIAVISLMTIPTAQRESCTLIEVKTIPVVYDTYTTYHTYLYFEDSDGNIFKRSLEDMRNRKYSLNEKYKINTWL